MTLAIDNISLAPRVKRWTKREYNELVQLGVFRSQRVYLFRGEIIEMSPQLKRHAYAVLHLWMADPVIPQMSSTKPKETYHALTA